MSPNISKTLIVDSKLRCEHIDDIQRNIFLSEPKIHRESYKKTIIQCYLLFYIDLS